MGLDKKTSARAFLAEYMQLCEKYGWYIGTDELHGEITLCNFKEAMHRNPVSYFQIAMEYMYDHVEKEF